ncbi:hypothetical protein M422DRAFT_249772 [Sphaerobolus stellatus SS14]|uniref:tyrosinase n=1 Tax=Sphaerobolus stellatus (strain SS14) TaxID=990650 RepID=A0A0C9W3M0_SPHS4|nr:hypothetical protein M422DRAFT_249772 [Sphaerobolus stellatus SS14]
MSHFVITGSGTPANRLEINDLIKDDKSFSLYIQALADMSSRTQNDVTSFFQVGGIHGLPFIPWDDATGNSLAPNQWGGYCTHGSVLFPTWHRPYVMLYEQILNQSAQKIAATYTTDTASWQQAATNLRQPYWDWAKNAVPPPEVISLAQVTITTPTGRKAVTNPLIRYKFHPIDPSFPDPYSQWPTTLRQPNSTDPNAKDNVTRLTSVLRSAQRDITTKTYNLLSRVTTWPAFSNHNPGDGGSSSNSLEAIHDGIHVDVGGNGQMSDPSVAAFDPIFFLHHANVDRMVSLWSALNPGVWVTSSDEDDGTFTIPPDDPVDASTPLTPFWNAQTTFWASADVTDTSELGYTYPEFNGLDMTNTTAVQQAIAQAVNRLYGSGSRRASVPRQFLAMPAAAVKEGAKATAAAIVPSDPVTAAGASLPSGATTRSIGVTSASQPEAFLAVHHNTPAPPEGNIWDWSARIEFKKYELGSSFTVLIFLGQVPENPEDWRIAPNCVGAHHAFVNRLPDQCANCQNQLNIITEGFVHLNEGIAEFSGLGSFEPDVIHPYLEKEMHWRVQKTDGSPAQLESLEVTVIATPLSLPPGSAFPVAGEPTRHPRITHGRPGGARQV